MNKFLGFLFSLILTLLALNYEPGMDAQAAIPWVPIAIGASLLGSFLNNRSANKGAKAAQQRAGMIDQQLLGFIGGLGGQRPGGAFAPMGLEQMGMQQYQAGPRMINDNALLSQMNLPGMPEIPNVYRDLGLATDPILDMLGGGGQYDTSLISSALDPIRQRNLQRSVAELHAAAPGLGSRFGSAVRRGEVDLRRQNLEDTSAIDAQMLFQAHEAAQARRLQAANSLLGMGQLQLGRDQGALGALMQQAGVGINQGQLNLAQGQFGLDRSRLSMDAILGAGNQNLAAQGQQNQLLQLLLGSQTNRSQQQLQALGLMSGQQVPSAPGYGNMFGDLGQMLLMMQLAQGKGKTA
jgi:hypothetical protein